VGIDSWRGIGDTGCSSIADNYRNRTEGQDRTNRDGKGKFSCTWRDRKESKPSSIGKGTTSVKSSAPASFWTEQVDIDDDGTVEDNQFLWDAQRGVLYTYREDDFSCANGKPETGKILMAIYAKGNKAGQPVGSGWYVVGLNAGQCGVAKEGAYGCKFDASGNYTACGAAVVNNKTGELDAVVVK
jgi:hypothetical protein